MKAVEPDGNLIPFLLGRVFVSRTRRLQDLPSCCKKLCHPNLLCPTTHFPPTSFGIWTPFHVKIQGRRPIGPKID